MGVGDVWSRGGLQPQQGTQTGDTTWMTPNPFYLRNKESADVPNALREGIAAQ